MASSSRTPAWSHHRDAPEFRLGDERKSEQPAADLQHRDFAPFCGGIGRRTT
jgi:hypothetical protein